MKTRPNQTLIRAVIQAYTPAPDGWGGHVDLLVKRNETPDPQQDFIRPAEGSVCRAFCPEPPTVAQGRAARVTLTYLGGPQGGQPVVQKMEPADPTPSGRG